MLVFYSKNDKKVEINQKEDFMIERSKYLNQLINTKNNGFPKVITGVHRYETDFLATKGNKTFYVRVADDISKDETLKREKRPYSHLKDPIQKILVVNKPFKEMRDQEGYILIGISDFLLRFIK